MSLQPTTFTRSDNFVAFNSIDRINVQPLAKTNPVAQPNIKQIASANLDFNGWPDLGVGVKTKVPLGAGEAEVEVVANVPLDTLKNILNKKSFNLNLEAKLKTDVDIGLGKTQLELKAKGTATFPNAYSAPKIALEGSASIGVELKNAGNPVGSTIRENKSARYAGVTFKWDGGAPEFGLATERKGGPELTRGNQNYKGKSIVPGILTVEGSSTGNRTGDPVLAAMGGIGGPASSGKNEIKLSVNGKLAVTNPNPAFPVTIQVKTKGVASLTLTNDNKNGLWTLRQVAGMRADGKPTYRVIGKVNLPELASKISSAVTDGFNQVVNKIPGISEVRNIINPKPVIGPPYTGPGGRYELPSATQKPLPQITAKPQAKLKPVDVVLGVNQGGPLSPKNFKFLEANRSNALTEVITSLYQGNVVNTYKQAGWKGNWTTPAPVGGRPGVEWQMRLSPKDKNTVDIRVANTSETWAYSVNLGKDGRFKVDGPNEQRNLPAYLENLCKGIADSPTVQAAKVEKTTFNHPELVKLARQNPQSDAAYVVRGLDDAVLAPKDNPGFAKQLKNMMNGVGPKKINESKNGVDVVWTNAGGALQVSVSRAGGNVTYANVSYNRQMGTYAWSPVNLDLPKTNDTDIGTNTAKTPRRPVDELGSENALLKKALANPQSREARMVKLIDTIYFNAAKPDGQENRDILKQISRNGRYVDRYGDVQTQAIHTKKGDRVVVTGGKGVIIVTVTPADPKSSAYVYRTGIDSEGLPMLRGSSTRTKDPQFFENSMSLQPRAVALSL
jgi:hypothetical protein